MDQIIPRIYSDLADNLPPRDQPSRTFNWNDIQIKLEVLPTVMLPFGACNRASVWARTKPVDLYRPTGLMVRKREARRLLEDKDLALLEKALPVATYQGQEVPRNGIIHMTTPTWDMDMHIPLTAEVEGRPTAIFVRSLAARAACTKAIYGGKIPVKPQPRDLAIASLLLYRLGSYEMPWRGIDRVMFVYSDQALMNVMEFTIELTKDGPAANGLVYEEMAPNLVMDGLTKLAANIEANIDTPDYLFESIEHQLAASSADYISQKDVGYHPVAGWPCRTCPYNKACLPPEITGLS